MIKPKLNIMYFESADGLSGAGGTTEGTGDSQATEFDSYAVTFDYNGGTDTSGASSTSRGVISGGSVGELPAPTKSGSILQGWKDSNNTPFYSDTAVYSNMTVYAQWSPSLVILVDIEFYNNSSATSTDVPDTTLRNISAGKTKLDLPNWPADPEPTSSNLMFKGWKIMGTNTMIDDRYAFTENTKLVAVYGLKCTVTFKFDDGTTSDETIYVVEGTPLLNIAPEPRSISGYRFVGWYQGSTPLQPSTLANGIHVVTAHWAQEIIIAFNPNNGSPIKYVTTTVGSQIGASDFPWDPQKAPTTTPPRSFYTFDGWYSGNTQISASTIFNESMTVTARYIKSTNPEDITPENIIPLVDNMEKQKSIIVNVLAILYKMLGVTPSISQLEYLVSTFKFSNDITADSESNYLSLYDYNFNQHTVNDFIQEVQSIQATAGDTIDGQVGSIHSQSLSTLLALLICGNGGVQTAIQGTVDSLSQRYYAYACDIDPNIRDNYSISDYNHVLDAVYQKGQNSVNAYTKNVTLNAREITTSITPTSTDTEYDPNPSIPNYLSQVNVSTAQVIGQFETL